MCRTGEYRRGRGRERVGSECSMRSNPSALPRFPLPPKNKKWTEEEIDALDAIVNGKEFQRAMEGRQLKAGTWTWVHEKMAKNTKWEWARSWYSIQRYFTRNYE